MVKQVLRHLSSGLLQARKKKIYIFSVHRYNGHGNGTQFLSSNKIERLKVDAVVLLFGCGSLKVSHVGPGVEMKSSYQMYLIACR